MERRLPEGLSQSQRSALLEFFGGGITAGQLSERLHLQPDARSNRAPSQGKTPGSGDAAASDLPSAPDGLRKKRRTSTRKLVWLLPLIAHDCARARGCHRRTRS